MFEKPERKIDKELIVKAIQSLKDRGWDVNPYTLADELTVPRTAIYRSTEAMELIVEARQGTFGIDVAASLELARKIQGLEQSNAQLNIKLIEMQSASESKLQPIDLSELKPDEVIASASTGKEEPSVQLEADKLAKVGLSLSKESDSLLNLNWRDIEAIYNSSVSSLGDFAAAAKSAVKDPLPAPAYPNADLPVAQHKFDQAVLPEATPSGLAHVEGTLPKADIADTGSLPIYSDLNVGGPHYQFGSLPTGPEGAAGVPEAATPEPTVLPEPAPAPIPEPAIVQAPVSIPEPAIVPAPAPVSIPEPAAIQDLGSASALTAALPTLKDPAAAMTEVQVGEPTLDSAVDTALNSNSENLETSVIFPDLVPQISFDNFEPVPLSSSDFYEQMSHPPSSSDFFEQVPERISPPKEKIDNLNFATDIPDLENLDIFEGFENMEDLQHIEVIDDVNLDTEASKPSFGTQSEVDNSDSDLAAGPKTSFVPTEELRNLVNSRIKQASDSLVDQTAPPKTSEEAKSAQGLGRSKFVGSGKVQEGKAQEAVDAPAFVLKTVPADIRKACLLLGVRPEELSPELVQDSWKRQIAAPGVHPDQGGDTESAIYLNTAKDLLLHWLEAQAPKLGKRFKQAAKEQSKAKRSNESDKGK